MAIKQVILVRRDLKMGRGKMSSQVAHATMKVFFSKMFLSNDDQNITNGNPEYWVLQQYPYFKEYIEGAFKKVVLWVDDEAQLLSLYRRATDAGIHTSLIRDAGLTAFNGVPTLTCAAIGPWDAEEIDEITGQLKLA